MQAKHPSIAAVGREIRARRVSMGLSQEEMAERSGVHRTYYSSVERGAFNLTLIALFRIANGLKCDPSELLPPLSKIGKLPPQAKSRGRRAVG